MAKRLVRVEAETPSLGKICCKCKTFKGIEEFYKRSDKPHLYASNCKDCQKKLVAVAVLKNKNKKLARDKEYHKANREKRNAYSKEYLQNNREEKRKRFNERYEADLNFRLLTNVRNRINIALKRNTKSARTIALVGCTIEFLKTHIATMFTEGMGWDNYGDWQIDHKIPCASFNFAVEEEQKKCFHFSNLQPLWAKDNRIKSANFNTKEVCFV